MAAVLLFNQAGSMGLELQAHILGRLAAHVTCVSQLIAQACHHSLMSLSLPPSLSLFSLCLRAIAEFELEQVIEFFFDFCA